MKGIDEECLYCSKQEISFRNDPVENLILRLPKPRPLIEKIVAVTHNARTFVLKFILNRVIRLQWEQLVTNGSKIMCMKAKHVIFPYSLYFLAMPVRKFQK
jgi:hypothetical protein